ncbi:MAG: doxx family protein [Bacteroidia bacterium]
MFGVLKFFPGASPAEEIAITTIDKLTFGMITGKVAIITLAVWEFGLGLLLVSRKYVRIAVVAGIIHMLLTFSPFFLLPELSFTEFPKPTLLGQYILKNIVFIGAFLMIYPKKK